MTKQEYISQRAKQDFIRFVLLRTPRLSSREAARKLTEAMDTDGIAKEMKTLIDSRIDSDLSIEKIKDSDGKILRVIPDWLNPDLAESIVSKYRDTIQLRFNKESCLPGVLHHIEKLTWSQGVDDMIDHLETFLAMLTLASKHCAEINHPDLPDFDLKDKYEAAKRVTVREKLMGDNDKDVLEFRNALTDYVREWCQVEMYAHLSRLYSEMASDIRLHEIISAYGKAKLQAESELKATLRLCSNAEWEADYRQLMPIGFFEKNIEDIDATMAFHMILFQSFANHEEYLRNNGLLTQSGELRIFTSPSFDGTSWIHYDFSQLLH